MSPLPQGEFVQAVLDRLGLTQTELGVELRKPSAYQTVHKWLKGTKEIGYEDLMWMLEKCGWLNINGDGLTPLQEKRRLKLLREAESLVESLRRELG